MGTRRSTGGSDSLKKKNRCRNRPYESITRLRTFSVLSVLTANFTLPKVPSPKVLPISYLPTRLTYKEGKERRKEKRLRRGNVSEEKS